MPGNGPAAKPDGQRRRRNKPTYGPERVVIDDGALRGPAYDTLPVHPDGPTAVWWETWRRAPQAVAFAATDWQRLAMLVPLVDAYWREPDPKGLTEIRLNEERLGATVVDRLRARIRIAIPDAPDPDDAAPASPEDRFADRLGDDEDES